MSKILKPYSMITDFVTGKEIPNVGAEENRQMVEQFLVNEKGFSKEDIAVDVDIEITIAGETYRSQIDLVVSVDDECGSTPWMAIKCAAASLGSREREILAASRLLTENQLPYSVVSDGKTAIVLDTVSGKKLGEGLNAILSKAEAREKIKEIKPLPFPKQRREREKLIFRSFDSMNVNVSRNL
jgi:hypothetical protein